MFHCGDGILIGVPAKQVRSLRCLLKVTLFFTFNGRNLNERSNCHPSITGIQNCHEHRRPHDESAGLQSARPALQTGEQTESSHMFQSTELPDPMQQPDERSAEQSAEQTARPESVAEFGPPDSGEGEAWSEK